MPVRVVDADVGLFALAPHVLDAGLGARLLGLVALGGDGDGEGLELLGLGLLLVAHLALLGRHVVFVDHACGVRSGLQTAISSHTNPKISEVVVATVV